MVKRVGLGQRVRSFFIIFSFVFVSFLSFSVVSASDVIDQQVNRIAFKAATDIVNMVRGSMDATAGKGTGWMANELQEIALSTQKAIAESPELETIPSEVWLQKIRGEIGSCLNRDSVVCSPDGHYKIPVHQLSRAVEHGNNRLKKMDLGIIELVQSPEAVLLEEFYAHAKIINFNFFSIRKKVALGEPKLDIPSFIALSQKLYGAPNGDSNSVYIPFAGWNSEETKKLFSAVEERFAEQGHKIKLVVHDSVIEEGQERPDLVVLPRGDEPLPQHRKKYENWRKFRTIAFPLNAFVGTMMGGGPGKWVGTGTGGAVGAATEWQFGRYSDSFWNYIWYKYGQKALAGANLGIPYAFALITSAAAVAAGEMTMADVTGKLWETTVRTIVLSYLGITISFATMQKYLAILKDRGESSPLRRFVFETSTGIVPQLARALVTGAAVAGANMAVGNLWGVEIGKGDVLSMILYGIFVATVSGPLWLKVKFGDDINDGITRETLANLSGAKGSNLGQGQGICSRFVAWLGRKYTQKRL